MGFVRRAHVRDFTAAQLEKCKKSEREREMLRRGQKAKADRCHSHTCAHAKAERKIMSTEKISRERETLKGSRRFSRRGPNCVSES
jgi:hypothetical protein